jgi:hypothetical protein
MHNCCSDLLHNCSSCLCLWVKTLLCLGIWCRLVQQHSRSLVLVCLAVTWLSVEAADAAAAAQEGDSQQPPLCYQWPISCNDTPDTLFVCLCCCPIVAAALSLPCCPIVAAPQAVKSC